MPDIILLHQMIKDSAKVTPRDVYGKKSVTLIETQSPDSKVEITGLPDNAIIIKIDLFPSPGDIFKGIKGECKRADYVIIAESVGKKRIVFIEMKKTKGSEKEIMLQLKGAECALAYGVKIAEKFYGAGAFLKGFRSRFITFGHTSIRKQRTRVERRAGIHDCPERMMKIHGPNRVQYNHLAGA